MRRFAPLATFLAAMALLAACSPGGSLAPTLVATTPDVYGILVGGTADGPELLHTMADSTAFDDEYYTPVYDYIAGGTRPTYVPADLDGVLWGLTCAFGLEEAVFVDPDVSDAWDGGQLGYFDGVFGDYVDFETGTVREYSDGTIVLSCTATVTPEGVTVERHVVVPGAGAEGRFAVDVFAVTNTSDAALDLVPFAYYQNDGADDEDVDWQDYGTIGAFEWATKDSGDLSDPAVGLVPLLATGFAVDEAETFDDNYYLEGVGTLPAGATTAFAMLGGVRGGFEPGDGPGKDTAMQALGAELATLDGGAVCATAASTAFAWTLVVEDGAAIVDAICDGYDALP